MLHVKKSFLHKLLALKHSEDLGSHYDKFWQITLLQEKLAMPFLGFNSVKYNTIVHFILLGFVFAGKKIS